MRRIAVLACVLALGLVACTKGSDFVHVVSLNEPLPTISGPSLTGGSKLSTDTYRGKILVLNVWASWCGPCKQEQPDLVKVANAYATKGVEFLGINYQDDQAQARSLIKTFDVPYPSLVDASGKTAAQLKYPSAPDTFIVDASGTQRYLIIGRTTQTELSHYLDLVLASPTSGSP
ncbi:MAG: TlpA disulfide reductase family protein [Actinomycetota bacterium]